ncbi:MAG: hypothetical protein ACLQGP_17700 [Isosphaeraceae bacterium]
MNRLLLILASGIVAGGILTSALALAQAPATPLKESSKDRKNGHPVPGQESGKAAEIEEARAKEREALLRVFAARKERLVATRRRQRFNLANQLRPLYRYELMSVRTACGLTPEQFRLIRPETDTAFDEVIANLFEAQLELRSGPGQVPQARDYETLIRDAVFRVVKRHVPAGRWAAFQEDLGRRESSRKQAGVEFLVAILDRELRLSGPQRDQLEHSLSAHWDSRWYWALEVTLGGNACVPPIPDELVRPYLSETQRGIWSRTYKFEGPLWGVALDHGGDPEMERALGGATRLRE